MDGISFVTVMLDYYRIFIISLTQELYFKVDNVETSVGLHQFPINDLSHNDFLYCMQNLIDFKIR